MKKFSLIDISNAVIIGAGHGIGLSLVKSILDNNSNAIIFASFREEKKATDLIDLANKNHKRLFVCKLDPLNSSSLEKFREKVSSEINS